MASSLSSSRLLSSRPEPGSRRRRGDDATQTVQLGSWLLLEKHSKKCTKSIRILIVKTNRDRLVNSIRSAPSLKDYLKEKFWAPSPVDDEILYSGSTFERSADGKSFKQYGMKPVVKTLRALSMREKKEVSKEEAFKTVFHRD